MEQVQDIVVAVFAITIMLSVGVDLTGARLREVFKHPKSLLYGLGLNHLLVPFLALGLARLFSLSDVTAVGFLLCASAPGGPVGALLTQRAGGDLAYAASQLLVMTLVNTVATPTFMILAAGDSHRVGFSEAPAMVRTIALYLITPLFVGIALRERRPQLADKALRALKIFTNVLFGVLFVGVCATRWELTLHLGFGPVGAMLVCVLICVAIGVVLPVGPMDRRTALGLMSGVRNIALSLLLANSWFREDETILTVMVYGLVMLIGAVPLAVAFKRAGKRLAHS